MSEIIRALLESYDQSTHRADVRPARNPASLLTDLPVVRHCPGEFMADESEVAVLLWDDTGGVVLGPYDDTFDWPVTAHAYDGASRSFTAQAWTAYPNLSVSISIKQTSCFWVLFSTSGRCDQVRTPTAWQVAAHLGGVLLNPRARVGSPVAGTRTPVALCFRTQSSYAPGTYNIDVRVYCQSAGDTITCRYAALSVMALPA